MKISAYTPSYNKPEYVTEAINSVITQNYADFTYWIDENSDNGITYDAFTNPTFEAIMKHLRDEIKHCEENGLKIPDVMLQKSYFKPEVKKRIYPTAQLLNRYLEDNFKGDVFVYLSDDDYLLPGAFQKIADLFVDPNKMVAYFGMRVMQGTKETGFNEVSVMKAEKDLPIGTNMDCMLDGGMVAFRRECLNQLTQPYFRTEMDNDTAHCDGIFLNRLSQLFTFYAINDILAVKRRTDISTFIHY